MGAARSLAVWRDVRSSLAHKNAKQANVKEGERERDFFLFFFFPPTNGRARMNQREAKNTRCKRTRWLQGVLNATAAANAVLSRRTYMKQQTSMVSNVCCCFQCQSSPASALNARVNEPPTNSSTYAGSMPGAATSGHGLRKASFFCLLFSGSFAGGRLFALS